MQTYTYYTQPQQQASVRRRQQQPQRQQQENVRRWYSDADSTPWTSIREGIASYLFLVLFFAAAGGSAWTSLGSVERGIAVGMSYAAASAAFGCTVLVNPLLTLFAQCTRRCAPLRAFAHALSQMVGALLAATTVRYGFLLSLDPVVPRIAPSSSLGTGFFCEFIAAYVLCLASSSAFFPPFSVTRKQQQQQHQQLSPTTRMITVTMAYVAVVASLGPISTGFANPWLALSAECIGFFNAESWVFYVAPLAALLAASLVAWTLMLPFGSTTNATESATTPFQVVSEE